MMTVAIEAVQFSLAADNISFDDRLASSNMPYRSPPPSRERTIPVVRPDGGRLHHVLPGERVVGPVYTVPKDLAAHHAQQVEARAQAESRVDALTNENRELRDANARLQTTLDAAVDRNLARKEKIDSLERQREDYSRRLSSKDRTINEQLRTISDLNRKVERLTRAIQSNTDDKTNGFRDRDKTIADLQAALHELSSRYR
jgi:DNA repair exonuclease SbcCD ATPase subunit